MNSEKLSGEEVKQQLSSYLQRSGTKLQTSLRLNPDLILEDALEQGIRLNGPALVLHVWQQLSADEKGELFEKFTGDSPMPLSDRFAQFAEAAVACDAAGFPSMLDKLTAGITSKR